MKIPKWMIAVRLLSTVAGVAVITGACLFLEVNALTAGFAYMVMILLVATRWGLVSAIVGSVVAATCLNYFFLPPLRTFVIADLQNWIALLAFLTTATVGSEISARAKRQASAAIARQHELERLHDLGRAILLETGGDAMARRLARRVAEAFTLDAVVLYEVSSAQGYKGGPGNLTIPPEVLDAALSGDIGERVDDLNARFSLVRLGGKPAGVLAVRGNVSDAAMDAISNLVAIGLERARAQETETRAQAAREGEELKSTLLDAVAHEFKTPLTSIKAAITSVLSETGLPDRQRELLSIVDEETDRLNGLVSDAIQLSRLAGGEFKLNRTPVSPAALVRTVVFQMRHRLDDRLLEGAREDLPEDSMQPIYVDRDLIELSLRQLIDNALKYSDVGTPISIGTSTEDGSAVFWVADEGPGVPVTDLDRVFLKFYRAGATKHGVPGSGVGLSVVREIARAHGGDAAVTTEPGRGSRFVITIPVRGIDASLDGAGSEFKAVTRNQS